ncbi:hypothetical protein Metme_1842 [Methylomonas methanica MC09]|uniref:Uncharacterized protein n=1 Tax=Methylomonas methanica (strain DSM 25384 / MC09) TaxID=857087 RepID=G0A3F9_METMM|nr:hypothetical protein Metme_1842 [Methylomonas methanica MC09]
MILQLMYVILLQKPITDMLRVHNNRINSDLRRDAAQSGYAER